MLVTSCQQELKPDMSAAQALSTQADMFGPVKRRLDFLIKVLLAEQEALTGEPSGMGNTDFGGEQAADFLSGISETLEDIGHTAEHIEAFSNQARKALSKEQPALKANGKAKPKSKARKK